MTSESFEHMRETVRRALDLGARHIDVGQRPEEGHVVLADPEGNEFCVIEPGNNFLAECGFIGALSSDGSQEVGYFWSEALGWPLVWDQDQETAIQSPGGGTKIAWGGPPVAPRTGKNRLHFDLAPPLGEDQQADKVRQLINEKNELYFHRWRPQNVTYLFLFRKHEQGQNAAEIPKFDPIVERKEQEIARLRQPTDLPATISPVK